MQRNINIDVDIYIGIAINDDVNIDTHTSLIQT